MKKTLTLLFSLAALCSTAMGATIKYDAQQLNNHNGSITIDGGFGTGANYGNITISMSLDAKLLSTLITNHTTTNIISVTGTGSGSTLGASINNIGGVSSTFQNGLRTNLSTNFRTELANIFTNNTITAASFSMTIGGTSNNDAAFCLTLQKDDGTFLEYYGIDAGLKTDKFKELKSFTYSKDLVQYIELTDSILTEQIIKETNISLINKQIPEPATATLSLLGLGALLLRRRRA